MLVGQEARVRDSLAPPEVERMIYHRQLKEKNSVCQQRANCRTSGNRRNIDFITILMALFYFLKLSLLSYKYHLYKNH